MLTQNNAVPEGIVWTFRIRLLLEVLRKTGVGSGGEKEMAITECEERAVKKFLNMILFPYSAGNVAHSRACPFRTFNKEMNELDKAFTVLINLNNTQAYIIIMYVRR